MLITAVFTNSSIMIKSLFCVCVCVVKIFKIYSLSNFQVYNTVLFPIITLDPQNL